MVKNNMPFTCAIQAGDIFEAYAPEKRVDLNRAIVDNLWFYPGMYEELVPKGRYVLCVSTEGLWSLSLMSYERESDYGKRIFSKVTLDEALTEIAHRLENKTLIFIKNRSY